MDANNKAIAAVESKSTLKYRGYEYDEETKLYYLNCRMYDPSIARFLQEDTYRGQLNDPLSLNLYTYCDNNPVVYADPTGHTPRSERCEGADDRATTMRPQSEMEAQDREYAKEREERVASPEPIVTPQLSKKTLERRMVVVEEEAVEIPTEKVALSAGKAVISTYMYAESPKYLSQITAIQNNKPSVTLPKTEESNALGSLVIAEMRLPVPPHFKVCLAIVTVFVGGIYYFAKAPNKSEETGKVEDVSKTTGESDESINNTFPENPDDFNPSGLEKHEYKGGKIVKWIDPKTKKAIYEWNEELRYGDHYHYTPDGKTRVPNPETGDPHLKPGDTIPK